MTKVKVAVKDQRSVGGGEVKCCSSTSVCHSCQCSSGLIIYPILMTLHTNVQNQDTLDEFTFQAAAVKVKVSVTQNR